MSSSTEEIEDNRAQYRRSLRKCNANHGRYSLLTTNFSSDEYYIGDFKPSKVYYNLLANTEIYCADGFECIPHVHLCIPCPFGKHCPAGSVRYNNSALVNMCEKGNLCESPREKEACPESYACGFGSAFLDSPVTPSCNDFENEIAVYCPEGSALNSKFYFDNICKGGFYCPKKRDIFRK